MFMDKAVKICPLKKPDNKVIRVVMNIYHFTLISFMHRVVRTKRDKVYCYSR